MIPQPVYGAVFRVEKLREELNTLDTSLFLSTDLLGNSNRGGELREVRETF